MTEITDNSPIILCEGPDDEGFLTNLIKTRALGSFTIRKDFGGNSNFGERLIGLKADRGIGLRKAVLIVADNDSDPEKSFQAIRAQIVAARQYDVPRRPMELSQRAEGLPPVAVLMLPWTGVQGCLETICYESAARNFPQGAQCVEQFMTCVGAGVLEPSKLAKTKMRSFLTSTCKSDPNTGLRFAWSRQETLVPLADPCFNNIAAFLQSLSVL